jgi:hypothetical protein
MAGSYAVSTHGTDVTVRRARDASPAGDVGRVPAAGRVVAASTLLLERRTALVTGQYEA